MFLLVPIIRFYRYMQRRCLVCGTRHIRVSGKSPLSLRNWDLRYCSIECAAYDKALVDPRKSWILFGTLSERSANEN